MIISIADHWRVAPSCCWADPAEPKNRFTVRVRDLELGLELGLGLGFGLGLGSEFRVIRVRVRARSYVIRNNSHRLYCNNEYTEVE